MLFRLADRFQEPDVRKIANLPMDLIYAWDAYYHWVDEAGKGD